MRLYAELPGRRAAQVVGDALVVAWVAWWVRAGAWIHELVGRLAGPGRTLEGAGRGLASPLDTAAREVSDIPLVGDALSSPFDAAADAGRRLADAGAGQQEVVATLALWLGVLLALTPISLLLVVYLPRRLRWIRHASAAHRLRRDAGDLELFALRAVVHRPLAELHSVTPDPIGALRSGDHAGLAALELRALGLRP